MCRALCGERKERTLCGHFMFFPFSASAGRGYVKFSSLFSFPWGLIRQGLCPGVKQQVRAGSLCSSTSPSISSQPEGRGHVEVAAGSLLPLPPPMGVPGKDARGTEGEMPRQARLVTLGRSGLLMRKGPWSLLRGPRN